MDTAEAVHVGADRCREELRKYGLLDLYLRSDTNEVQWTYVPQIVRSKNG